MKDSASKFSSMTVFLHWVVGLTIIGMIAIGIYMEENDVYALFPIHKSIGAIILVFIAVRVIWRLMNGWPTPVGDSPHWQHMAAKLVHWVLLIGTILFPISGLMMSVGGGRGLAIFGWEIVPLNVDPVNPEEVIALNESLAGLGHTIHGTLADVMIIAIVLHVVGALKHHVVDKDATLRRMLGKSIS